MPFMDYLICWRFFLPVKVLSPPYKANSYVPMFGETEFDPIQQFHSIDIEEQLDALGRAVDAGKVTGTIKGFAASVSLYQCHF
ncbi:hypothetical protein CsSME_00012893 [Camellia sinensis var. sinensis]